MVRVVRFRDPAALADALAQAIADAIVTADRDKTSALMLAGGQTPLEAYRRLARLRPDCPARLTIFLSDDRHVPPDHPKSNYGAIAPLLLEAGIGSGQVLRVRDDLPPEEAAGEYDAALARLFSGQITVPLGLLGMGADGHTASLFRQEDLAKAAGRWAIAVQRPDGLNGISATPQVFARIARILIAVTGPEKREVARRFLTQPVATIAGQALKGHRGVELWCDSAAWPFD